MTINTKGRNGGNRATPKHHNQNANYTKPSRISRKHKGGWKGARK